jgi:hypothetical protein
MIEQYLLLRSGEAECAAVYRENLLIKGFSIYFGAFG